MQYAPKSHRPRSAARRVTRAASALAALFAVSGTAAAHPHVWVTVESTVVFEGGSITGFRHKWTFDEFYTTMAVEGLDTNKDGKYSREELAELAKVNIDGLTDFQFFTTARLGSQTLALADPKDYWLEHHEAAVDPNEPKAKMLPRASEQKASEANKPGFFARLWDLIFGAGKTAEPQDETPKVVSLHFTLPLKEPVLADAPDFSFAVIDPSFYIAFELAKNEPIKLGAGAPAGCRIEITDAEQKIETDERRLNEAFSQQLGGAGLGFVASKPIKLSCGPRT